jgi:endonuclease G
MILSNWHVLAGYWSVPEGLPVYQPVQPWGSSWYRIARFRRHAMDRNLDAAVAELTGERRLVNDQLNLGPVKGARSPELGMGVKKSGRTTRVTAGVITGVEGYRVRYYDGVRQVVRNIVHIAQVEAGSVVSSSGDSGAWWVDDASQQAVGLHFAGSDVPEYALALSMPEVLDALDVSIAA